MTSQVWSAKEPLYFGSDKRDDMDGYTIGGKVPLASSFLTQQVRTSSLFCIIFAASLVVMSLVLFMTVVLYLRW